MSEKHPENRESEVSSEDMKQELANLKKGVEKPVPLMQRTVHTPEEIRRLLSSPVNSDEIEKETEVPSRYQRQAREIAIKHLGQAEYDLDKLEKAGISTPLQFVLELEKAEDLQDLPAQMQEEVVHLLEKELDLLKELPVLAKRCKEVHAERKSLYNALANKQKELIDQWISSYTGNPEEDKKQLMSAMSSYESYSSTLRETSKLDPANLSDIIDRLSRPKAIINKEMEYSGDRAMPSLREFFMEDRSKVLFDFRSLRPIMYEDELEIRMELAELESRQSLIEQLLTTMRSEQPTSSADKDALCRMILDRMTVMGMGKKTMEFYDPETETYNPAYIGEYIENINPKTMLLSNHPIIAMDFGPGHPFFVMPHRYKRSPIMIPLLLRSAEHLAVTRDYRFETTQFMEVPKWGDNAFVCTVAEQGSTVSSSIGNFYYQLSNNTDIRSVGSVVHNWMEDNRRESQSNKPFPKEAFSIETPGENKFVITLTGGQDTSEVFHENQIKEIFPNIPESNLYIRAHENLDEVKSDIAALAKRMEEAGNEQEPEILIIVDGHGSSEFNEDIPKPLLDYEGGYIGSTQLKGWEISDKNLSEAIKQLGKKAKIYIIINSCGSGAWLGSNERHASAQEDSLA